MKLEIKKVEFSDLYEIDSLQPEGWASIKDDFQYHINNPYATTIKGCIEDKLVGIGISLNFGETAWLDQIIVNPNFRGKGIGYKIVDFLMDELKKSSVKTVQLIATPLGESVYKRFGFSEISTYVSLENSLNHKIDISSNLVKCPSDRFDELLQLDKEINDENRSLLLEPHLSETLVFIDGNIQGYYIPSLYEKPIYAVNELAAKELIKLRSLTERKFVIPSENEIGIQILEQLGFCNQKGIGKRMLWGEPINCDFSKIYNRVGGNYG